MVNKKVWDASGMEGKRVVITAQAMGPRAGKVVTQDADTITLQNDKGQTLIVAKENITSLAIVG